MQNRIWKKKKLRSRLEQAIINDIKNANSLTCWHSYMNLKKEGILYGTCNIKRNFSRNERK